MVYSSPDCWPKCLASTQESRLCVSPAVGSVAARALLTALPLSLLSCLPGAWML